MLARAAFASRLEPDGRYRLGGSSRYVADGCGTLAEVAILDRVMRAVGEVMRRRALVDHRDEPCWPEAYLKRHAEAEEARLGLLAATDPAQAGIGPGGPSAGVFGEPPASEGDDGAVDEEADLSELAALADADEVEDDATGDHQGEDGGAAGGSDERGADGGGGDRGDDAGGEAELNRDSR